MSVGAGRRGDGQALRRRHARHRRRRRLRTVFYAASPAGHVRPHRGDHRRPLHAPRRLRRRRPHQVLHRRALPDRDAVRCTCARTSCSRSRRPTGGCRRCRPRSPGSATGARSGSAPRPTSSSTTTSASSRGRARSSTTCPGGEWRRVQRADGYRWVLVNGEVTIEDDKESDTYSGALLRARRLIRESARGWYEPAAWGSESGA